MGIENGTILGTESDRGHRCPAEGAERPDWSNPPGSAGVPPAQHWQSLAHLLNPGRPATTPGLCFGWAHAVPDGRVAGCPIAGKLSGTQRECMRARRPRSRVGLFPSLLLLEGARAGLPGCSPAHAVEPSCLVALRRPSWPLVDIFFRLCGSPAFVSAKPGSNFSMRTVPVLQR